MEDSDQLELIEERTIVKMFDEARFEIISRSGLVPQKSYLGNSSMFDLIWEVTNYELIEDIANILERNYNNLNKALQEFKDKFVNMFMTLHHNHVVKYSKFNWNWD